MPEILHAAGIVILFILSGMRIFATKKAYFGGYDLVYGAAVFILCWSYFDAPPMEAVIAALIVTTIAHFLSMLVTRRRDAREAARRSRKKPAKPAAKQAPTQKQKPQKETLSEKKPSPNDIPTPPSHQKEGKQTLTSCLRCGNALTDAICGQCQYDNATDDVRMLCRVDPRKLQLRK